MKIPDLLIRLEDIPAEGLDLNLNLPPDQVADFVSAQGQERTEVASPLRADLRISRHGRRLRLKGRFEVMARMTCDRCLAQAEGSISADLNELLELVDRLPDEADEALANEDSDGRVLLSEGRVDLSALLAELFWLSWPYRFVCRVDCAGLCPRCGVDLNTDLCACRLPNSGAN